MASKWNFGGEVPGMFDEHIRRSVPFYDEGHKLIVELSDFFVQEDSVCYEFGTSVGTLVSALAARHKERRGVRWIGVDCVPEMIAQAKTTQSDSSLSVEYVVDDINTVPLEKADLIICYYVVHFVPPYLRQKLIDRIFEALNWGGAFICFEKVRGPDARYQDYMTQIYHEWKLSQGHSAEDIMQKAAQLKAVLEPFSTQGNIDMFRRAGFVDIMTVQKWVSFEGFLCIK